MRRALRVGCHFVNGQIAEVKGIGRIMRLIYGIRVEFGKLFSGQRVAEEMHMPPAVKDRADLDFIANRTNGGDIGIGPWRDEQRCVEQPVICPMVGADADDYIYERTRAAEGGILNGVVALNLKAPLPNRHGQLHALSRLGSRRPLAR
jgi:hypothetical protein